MFDDILSLYGKSTLRTPFAEVIVLWPGQFIKSNHHNSATERAVPFKMYLAITILFHRLFRNHLMLNVILRSSDGYCCT